jgi:hypothetical protein
MKYSRNGQVPMADGVRCDGTQNLKRIVDHLLSDPHGAAVRADEAQELWSLQSDKHPWIKVLKSHQAQVVSQLIELAVSVHNDSKQMTLSARSWPSRSLAQMHAANQISSYCEHGLDSSFVAFHPPAAALHYRDPTVYREMLDIVAEVVMENVTQQIAAADCFSLQVDGSVDRYSVDNKFITARYVNKEREMVNVFLGESHSQKRGAEGLLDSVVSNMQKLGMTEVCKRKLTGITTDGESANTGKNGGLRVKLKAYVERDILCVWCVAHRSDLAFSDLEASVSEVRQWRINVKAVASFYRGSAVRTDELRRIADESGNQFYRFPEHFEVRFVEHLLNLCESVWKNLLAIRKHWSHISTEAQNATRGERATAKGFLKLWEAGGQQEYLTALMMDLLRLFEKLQKDCQKSLTTLCDIEAAKACAVASLSLMEFSPFPGGKEENQNTDTDAVGDTERRQVHNSLVTSRRNLTSMRTEIVRSAKEYLSQRLDKDQDDIVKGLQMFLDATTAQQMTDATRARVTGLFGTDCITQYCDEIIGHFVSGKLPAPDTTTTGKLFHMLKISVPGTIFAKLVQAFLSLTPHSIGPERAVSCHTILKGPKQSSYSRDAINSRMYISLNSGGTAHFDPRPAVAKFLMKKERRVSAPDKELYQSRDFVKKFFSTDSTV